MEGQNKIKWTVFFIVKSVDDSTNDLICMLKELREIKFDNNLSIVLCLHILAKNKHNVQNTESISEIENVQNIPPISNTKVNSGDEATILFYSFEEEPDEKDVYFNQLKFIKEDKNFDITNPRDLSSFFTESIKSEFAADRYMIFTWDHGASYGIFTDLVKSDKEKSENQASVTQSLIHQVVDFKQRSIPNIGIKSKAIKPLKNIPGNFLAKTPSNNGATSAEVSSQSMKPVLLTMEELAEAIKKSFGENKIDIVVMMNCYMQLFDAGYALRDRVKYLVAPETYIYFSGYNYKSIFSLLSRKPLMSTKKIASKIVSSFQYKGFDDIAAGNSAKASTALFATDLSCYSSMAGLIDELGQKLVEKLSNRKNELIMARCSIIPIDSGSPAIDFFNLLYNLRKTLGKHWARKLVFELRLTRHRLVVKSHIGDNYIPLAGRKFPSGITVFFPIQLGPVRASTAGNIFFKETAFFKSHNWGGFVVNNFENLGFEPKVINVLQPK